MLLAIARSVEPPNRVTRVLYRQGVKHRQHRCHANSGAQEHDRLAARTEREAAAGRAHLYVAPWLYARAQKGAGEAVFFLLDGHAIMPASRQVRQRITAQYRRRAGLHVKAQNHELPRQGRRQGCTLSGLEDERKHAGTLPLDPRHPHGAKSPPCGRWAHEREAGISFCLPFTGSLLQQRLEGTPPTSGQRRDAQGALQLSAGMTAQIEERIGLGDAHALRTIADLHDLVPVRDFASFQHSEVEPGPVMLHQQGGHTRLVLSDSNPVAGHSGLRHFEQRAANPITVANADLIVRQSLHREVLAELSKHEVLAPELPFPIAVGINLVDENGPVLATVTLQIS